MRLEVGDIPLRNSAVVEFAWSNIVNSNVAFFLPANFFFEKIYEVIYGLSSV